MLKDANSFIPLRGHEQQDPLSLMEEGKAQEAGDEMEIYLNLSERTVLKALERAVEHAS